MRYWGGVGMGEVGILGRCWDGGGMGYWGGGGELLSKVIIIGFVYVASKKHMVAYVCARLHNLHVAASIHVCLGMKL